MSDLLHTHLTFGFVPGCPACAQTREVFVRARVARLLAENRPVLDRLART